jgi:hypothetical protein
MNLKKHRHGIRSVLAGAAALAALISTPACKPSAPQAAPAPKPKPAVAVATNAAPEVDTAEFTSEFSDYYPADKGRDPFFPNSTRRFKAAPVISPNPVPAKAEPQLVLKGISKGRFVIINNAELEKGEEQGVRTGAGRVVLRVLEIGDDYVIVKVSGEEGTRKLMLEHKK